MGVDENDSGVDISGIMNRKLQNRILSSHFLEKCVKIVQFDDPEPVIDWSFNR